MPSALNKKRRNYQSLILLLKRDKNVYRPVYKEEEKKANSENAKQISDILPFKNYDDTHHCYKDNNTGKCMDFIKIMPKDLIGASDSEIEYDDLKFAKFYKIYSDDIKYIGINFPVDTSSQQSYIKSVMERTKDKQKLISAAKKIR